MNRALAVDPESQSIKYLLSLAYRNADQHNNSWRVYKTILPTVDSIAEYALMIDEKNRKVTESTTITGDDSQIHYYIDFYSHMQEMGLVDP